MRVWVCELKLLHLSRNVPLIKNQETTGSHHVFFTVYCSGLVLKTSSPTWRSSNAWRHEGSDRVTLAILVTLPMIGDPFLVTCFRDLIVFVFFSFLWRVVFGPSRQWVLLVMRGCIHLPNRIRRCLSWSSSGRRNPSHYAQVFQRREAQSFCWTAHPNMFLVRSRVTYIVLYSISYYYI